MRAAGSAVGNAAGGVRFDTGSRGRDEGFAIGVRRRMWMRRIAGSMVAGSRDGGDATYICEIYLSGLERLLPFFFFFFCETPHLGSRRIYYVCASVVYERL